MHGRVLCLLFRLHLFLRRFRFGRTFDLAPALLASFAPLVLEDLVIGIGHLGNVGGEVVAEGVRVIKPVLVL